VIAHGQRDLEPFDFAIVPGEELEGWWAAAFGYGFERLTQSEVKYLTRAAWITSQSSSERCAM